MKPYKDKKTPRPPAPHTAGTGRGTGGESHGIL